MTEPFALVIGASSGIGAATAGALATDGWRVLAVARTRRQLSELATDSELIDYRVLDVTDIGAVRSLITELAASSDLQLIVYAAGTNVPDRTIESVSSEAWDEILATNVTGAFHSVSAAIPGFRERGGGLVILVSSVSAITPDASGAAYQASKRAMLGLAHATTLEEHERGIRVSVICPGLVDTPFVEHRATPPTRETLDQVLTAQDTARTIAFVAGLPPRAYIPELTILPTFVQAIGATR